MTALLLAGVGAFGLVAVLRIWPEEDIGMLAHSHADLPPDHPHLERNGPSHAHAFVIDELHRRWPKAV